MSHIHLIGGEKGGVGKSVLARLLTQWCIDRQHAFAAVDADTSHSSLARAYNEYCQAIDLAEFASADAIMDRALGSNRRVIVDLPAQSARPLEKWLESGDILRFAQEAEIGLTLWHVTDGGFDSVRELERVFSRFEQSLQYVVVKNHGRSRDFRQFEESSAREQLDSRRGHLIELPELDSATMYAIDRSGASLWAAAYGVDGILTPMERQRTRLWLGRVYGAFDSLGAAI